MAEERSTAIELAKYPIAVFSIFLALVGAKYILEIPFGSVAEITKDGVKFTQDAKGEIASLSAQLNGAMKSIEEIKRQLPTTPLSTAAKAAVFEASQTVPDQTAQLTTVKSGGRDAELTGYIWIGDFNEATSSWQRVKLVSPATNEPLKAAPAAVAPGSVFAVSANMVLRDGLPQNDGAYFQGRKSLGVLPTGTRVKVLSTPVPINREFAVQYWLRVTAQP